MQEKTIGELLKFDGLAEAERITGKSYKEDELTKGIGLAAVMANNMRTTEALKQTNDTHFGMTAVEFIAMLGEIGFQEVYRQPFTSSGGDQMFYMFWHADGILLKWDTYGPVINSGNFYYAWKPKPEVFEQSFWDFTSSGGFREDHVWVGNHDCREGMRYNIQRLRDNGEFLNPWPESQYMQLNSSHEWYNGTDTGAASQERFDALPQEVRDCAIAPVYPKRR